MSLPEIAQSRRLCPYAKFIMYPSDDEVGSTTILVNSAQFISGLY